MEEPATNAECKSSEEFMQTPPESKPYRFFDSAYEAGCYWIFIIAFFASWIYAIANYGFLLGLGLGWLPSIFVALIAAALWPLILIVLVAVILFAI